MIAIVHCLHKRKVQSDRRTRGDVAESVDATDLDLSARGETRGVESLKFGEGFPAGTSRPAAANTEPSYGVGEPLDKRCRDCFLKKYNTASCMQKRTMTTERVKSLLLAMALGDGYIRKDRPELQINHGSKLRAYCEHKAKLLGEVLGRPIISHQKTYGGYDVIRFRVSHPYLHFVRAWLYKNDQKTLSLRLLRRLTDEAVAIWYMDDGSLYTKKRKGIPHASELVLSTCCATVEEAQGICTFFAERYAVRMAVKKMKGRFSVRCGTRDARQLFSILRPYCMAGMEYKFDPILENMTGEA